MRDHSRREFMGLTVAGMAGMAARPALRSGGSMLNVLGIPVGEPNLIVFNANVWTVDPTALAIASLGAISIC